MMKPVKRVFLILGVMSMFSLFQFDAMGKACNKKDIVAGKWCKAGGAEYDCRAGCYCVGAKKKEGIPATANYYVDQRCRDGEVDDTMKKAGVYPCPSGKTSSAGATSADQCYAPGDNNNNYDDCSVGAAAGQYCYKAGDKRQCKPGCYCPAGNKRAVGIVNADLENYCENKPDSQKEYLSARGVYYCPNEFPLTPASASGINQCYRNDDGIIKYYTTGTAANCTDDVSPGKFCKTAGTKLDCRPGCFCSGGNRTAIGTDIDVSNACRNRKYETRLNDSNIFLCPKEFPSSDAGAKEITDCYTVLEPTECDTMGDLSDCEFKYKEVTCGAGSYLPRLSYDCSANCPENRVCLGGTFIVSKDHMQGVYVCRDGKVPNSDQTKCVTSDGNADDDQGGSTGGGNSEHNCAVGQYWSDAIMASIERFNQNEMLMASVSFQPRSAKKVANKSVVSRAASNTKSGANASVNTKSTTGSSPRSLTVAGCTDCEAGYYCPDREHKYPCTGDASYTDQPRQTSCRTCPTGEHANGTHTGCDSDGITTYAVTYSCGEGSGTPPTDSNSHASGASVTLKSKGNCTAPSSMPDFDGWNCGNNIVGQAGDTITMPAANVICTAQWSTGVTCPAGKYLPAGGTLLADCVVCPAGKYCPGDDDHHECPDDTYINVPGSTSASDCHSCPSGEHAVNNHTGCSSNVVHCVAGKYLGANNQCVDCEEGYVCPGGNFEPGSNINGLRLPSEYCNAGEVVNSNQTSCVACTVGSPNSAQTQCTVGNATCVPGQWLNGTGCDDCSSNRFCPGDDGEYVCPTGLSPTNDNISCRGTLAPEQLVKGTTRNRECLRYFNNSSNYRECVYGISLESLRGN